MRAVRRLSDRILERFVPKVDASAVWYWTHVCTDQVVCTYNGRNYNTNMYCYCYDSTGYCTNCSPDGCC